MQAPVGGLIHRRPRARPDLSNVWLTRRLPPESCPSTAGPTSPASTPARSRSPIQ
uniref:Uncharacterized protein n=1 Tax=Macrostomum lignano TaxID=282301 RepID=A0A1I8HKH9_9PLAT